MTRNSINSQFYAFHTVEFGNQTNMSAALRQHPRTENFARNDDEDVNNDEDAYDNEGGSQEVETSSR